MTESRYGVTQPVERRRPVRPAWLLAAAGIIFVATIGARASSPPPESIQARKPAPQTAAQKAEAEEAAAVAAEELTAKVCLTCHPWEQITIARRTPREWTETVASMSARGAVGTKQQLSTITKFLTRYYGVVRVNTATAEELSAVLGLSAKDAAAVVAYRKVHGKFANAAALAKVDGIDKSRLEEQPEAIRYN